jgi:hypothetical protein
MTLEIQIPTQETIDQKLQRQKTKNPKLFPQPDQVFSEDYASTAAKAQKITALMIRSASIGDIATIEECLSQYREFVDINATDDAGSSALVYASCMGYIDIVKLLLDNGATVSPKEAKYISLLAVSNGHFEISQILSMYGTELVREEDEETLGEDIQLESLDEIANPLAVAAEQGIPHVQESISSAQETVAPDTPLIPTPVSLDEMHRRMDHVLTVAIQRILPSRKEFVPLGANVIFVHTLQLAQHSPDAVKTFLESAVRMIREWVSLTSHTYTLGYWISNCMQLLVYLKKDPQFMDTVEAQFQLTDLINEISHKFLTGYTTSIVDSVPGFLAFEKEKLDSIKYGDDFFSSFKTPRVVGEFFGYQQEEPISPHQMVQQLDSFVKICITTGLHTNLVLQLFARICRSFSATLFESILSSNELCCRARARLVQEHLSEIIGWVREKELLLNKTSGLIHEFMPTVQLLQFIQFVSIFPQLQQFKQLLHSVPKVQIAKIKKLMSQYRFEQGEPKFAQEVIDYVVGITVVETMDSSDETLRLPLQPDSSTLWTREALIPTVIRDMLEQ